MTLTQNYSLTPVHVAILAILGVGLLPIAPESRAQQPADPEEIRELCELVLCREPGTVRLTGDDGKPFESRFELPVPIVQNEWVSVFPGETVFVEAEVGDGRLVNLKAVAANRRPERTLELRMWQEAGKRETFLSIKNPFPRTVKYHAGMMLPTSDRLRKTSSCPVMSDGRMAFEMWPHAIFQLVLFDFRLVEGAAKSSCEF